MAIYLTGTLASGQLTYTTGDAISIKSDLGISLSDISGLNNLVFTTGNQTISGIKTFIDDTIFGTGDLALVVDGNNVNIKNLIVSGTSNFTNRPLVSSLPVLISGDLSTYITTGQTGAFYAASNPSGFITGIDNIVYTTGNQSISGVKTFLSQTNVSGIKFDVLSPEQIPAYQQGLVFYSDDYHTLSIYPDVPDLSLQVGQENWVRVKNGLSQTVNVGSVVYITGTNGVNPGFQLSIATNEGQSARTLGVVANTMAPNAPGYVTTFGTVNGIDTRGYSVGQTLYLSTSGSGQFSSLKPTAPNHMVRVGTVLTSRNDGSIFVTVQNGFELDELHDVNINGKTSGDFVRYNGTIWQNSTASINDLSDVNTQSTTPVLGYYLRWNGSSWVPQSGDGGGGGVTQPSDIIDLLFKQAYNTYYHELYYNPSGALTGVGVWNAPAKTTQLYTKQLNYSGEYLTGVVITDVISTNTLTKTLSYDGSDNLISTTRIYT